MLQKGTRPTEDRGLPPNTPVSWALSSSSSGVKAAMNMVNRSMPPTATNEIASWSRGKFKRPTPALSPSSRITTDARSRVHSVARGSTMRMSATISNACRPSLKEKILTRALAREVARTMARTPERASLRAVGKAKTRLKVDEEEAIASLTTTRT